MIFWASRAIPFDLTGQKDVMFGVNLMVIAYQNGKTSSGVTQV